VCFIELVVELEFDVMIVNDDVVRVSVVLV